MAKYISNWYGAYPSVTGSDIATGIINLTNSANNLYSVTYYGIAGLYDYTSTYISGYFYDGSDFAMYGSGFYTNLPTITELDIFASDGYKYMYAGSIKYNVTTDVLSGALNHIAIESPAGEKFDLYGNINVASTTATITKISYQYIDGTIIFSGSLNYNDLYGTISGNITSYQFIDSLGHSYTISNFSIPFSQLDLYSNLDLFVADIMTGNDNIAGTAAADVILGYAGNDTLDGAAGADTLVGGADDDTYIVDNIGDVVIENQNEGTDLVKVSIATAGGTYTLTDNVENATLTNTVAYNLTGNTLNNVLTGNAAINTLTGGDGNDTLDGGLGNDTMLGGDGNDTYIVNVATDLITELGGEGIDKVKSAVTYSLVDTDGTGANGGNVEDLELTGVAAINATGNDLNNVLTGNAAANILSGGAGNDTLNGGAGADTLDGGTGADAMDGGDGNDTYVVDDAGDTVTENNAVAATGGIDLVKSAISFDLSTKGLNVEKLTLTDGTLNGGTAAINATGNALANTLTGNAGDNILDGGAGVDALTGGKGNDTYNIDLIRTNALATSKVALQDTVSELANAVGSTVEGIDTINLTNLTGNAGAPTDFSNITSVTTLNVNANIENFNASQTGNLKLNITGNTLDNTLTGNAAANILSGGTGADTLVGGAGDDTYLVDAKFVAGAIQTSFDDTITETSTGGIDTLKLRGSTTLSQTLNVSAFAAVNNNIEGLDISLLAGNAKIDLTGDANDNILVGNAAVNSLIGGDGDDVLNGGAGADILNGGDGDDTYFVDKIKPTTGIGGDVIIDSDGNDTVKTTFSADLKSTQFEGIENLTLLGTAALNATGDEGDNELIGNDGANIIDGGTGADEMDGGKGADTYIVDDLGDEVSELFTAAQGGGVDLVKSSVTFELDDNIENLTLTNGTANLNGTGNELANIIIGNAGANVIDGDDGADRMIGGDGNDTYFVDHIGDIVTETNANSATGGIDIVNSEISYILGANLENLTLTDDDDINGTGNTLANTIIGNAGDNVLDGGASKTIIDSLIGGAGNDTYVVDLTVTGTGDATSFTIQDTVTESAGQGTDTLRLRGTLGYITARTLLVDDYATLIGQSIEGLDVSLTGSSKINLTGNSADNVLVGNAFTNTLIGDAGNDILDGKAGADIMNGGAGDDTYFVDVIKPTTGTGGDIIIEDNTDLNSGNDTVKTTFSANLNSSQFDGIENLTLLGTAALSATGDAGDNELIGNAGANIIKGEAGDDGITGGAGNDILTGGLGADTFVWELADKGTNGRPAIDRITDFNIAEDRLDLRDLLEGESGANILNFLDVTTSTAAGVTNTEIRISNTGNFASGNYAAAAENQHITLVGVNLLSGTNETDLLANLITQNKLIIDV